MLYIQGDPKQTDILEIATTLLWVNSGKKSNWILQWHKDNIWNHVLKLGYFENCALLGIWHYKLKIGWFYCFSMFLGFLPTFYEMTPNFLCLSCVDPPKMTMFRSQNYALTMDKPGVTLEKVPIFWVRYIHKITVL